MSAHFAVSTNGWSSHTLGLDWLKTVFDRYAKEKVKRGCRLLIIDRRSSHINLEFLDTCDCLHILVLVCSDPEVKN